VNDELHKLADAIDTFVRAYDLLEPEDADYFYERMKNLADRLEVRE